MLNATQVAGVVPAVGEHLIGRFLIVVIAKHDIGAFHPDFPDTICVRLVNYDVNTRHWSADRAGTVKRRGLYRDYRRGLGNAVALVNVQTEFRELGCNQGVESGAAAYEDRFAAEGFSYLPGHQWPCRGKCVEQPRQLLTVDPFRHPLCE